MCPMIDDSKIGDESRQNSTKIPTNIQLPVFDGKPETNVENWFIHVQALLKIHCIPQDIAFDLLLNTMSGSAYNWYIAIYKTALNSNQKPFNGLLEEFRNSLFSRFKPHNQSFSSRKGLSEIKQTSNLNTYGNDFQSLVQLAQPISEDDSIRYFINGLVTKTRLRVEYLEPSTLNAAISAAIRHNNAYSKDTTSVGLEMLEEKQQKCAFCLRNNHRTEDCFSLKKYHGSKKKNRNTKTYYKNAKSHDLVDVAEMNKEP